MEKSNTRRPKGSGSLSYDKKKQIYTLRKQCGYAENGKQKILVVTGKTETACLKKMMQKEQEWLSQKRESSIRSMNETVAELCERHLKYQMSNQMLAYKSIDRREGTINNQIKKYALGLKFIGAVKPDDIENHFSTLFSTGLSASSIKKAFDVINAAYNWALSRQEVDTNPCLSVKTAIKKSISIRERKDVDEMDVNVMNDVEYDRFVIECRKKNEKGEYIYDGAPILLLLLFTGMRVGEALALQVKDYDPETGLLSIYESRSMTSNRDKKTEHDKSMIMMTKETKNHESRVIELFPEAKEILKELMRIYPSRSPKDTIIPTAGMHTPNTANKLEYRQKLIFQKLGFSNELNGLHTLRRTFATRLYDQGIRVPQIAAYIGDLESTALKYYIAQRKRQIVNGESKVFVPLPTAKK